MSAEPYRSPTLQARRAQMFPVLADEELARLRWFGEPRRYADGECLFETGETSPDEKGFVTTGGGRLPLETSVPGVFAIGDVRAGSVKRVGGAIGEGAAVVAQIHAFLARENVEVEARAA